MTRPSDRWIKNYKNSRMIWHLADDTAVLILTESSKSPARVANIRLTLAVKERNPEIGCEQ